MLGKSCDQLPYNIIFVLDDDEGSPDEVIGHSRLCRVHGQEKACFVESGMDSALLWNIISYIFLYSLQVYIKHARTHARTHTHTYLLNVQKLPCTVF